MGAIRVDRLGVRFDVDRQRRPVTPAMRRVRRGCETEWALRDVSLDVSAGQSLAVVGPNGVGKTTLMRAIAGVLDPDEGEVAVQGRVGALLSIDAGLMPTLTGRENALLLGVLAGVPRDVARAALEEVKARTELDKAFERPVSTYSQGMRARLGFAVVEQTDPEVLLLDEVHEAIDERFRVRLEMRAQEILRRGGIVLAAGHDRGMLDRLCEGELALDEDGVRLVNSRRPEQPARLQVRQ